METPSDAITPNWRTVIPAIFFATLSLINKVTIGTVELAGGSTLAAIAALFLLWPLIRQLSSRGGSTEFLGLKIQLNSLEKRTESDYAIRIEALRVDLEELRKQVTSFGDNKGQKKAVEPKIIDDTLLKKAIAEYRAHDGNKDWKGRAEVDKRLVAIAGSLPVSYLKELLSQSPKDQETAMVVAMMLGTPHPNDDELRAAQLLVGLLSNPFERVRFRAAKTIERLGRRADTSQEARRIMIEGVSNAIKSERRQVIQAALLATHSALSSVRETIN